MVSKGTPKKAYPQKFRSSWLTDPQLKQWLRSENVLIEDGSIEKRPKCIYCDRQLCIRYKDLVKHAVTSKHLKNCHSRVKDIPSTKDVNDTAEVNNKTEEEKDEDYDEINLEVSEVDDEKNGSTAIEIKYTPAAPSPSATVFTTQRKLHVSTEGEISEVEGDSEMILPGNTPTSYQDEIERLKVERMKVELEQEKVKLYLLKLDVLQKEKELGLSRSAITLDM